MAWFSTTITPSTVIQRVLANKPGIKKVTQVTIVVRSMGTSTYSGIGGRDSQDKRLTLLADSLSIDTPVGKRYLDVSNLFIISDTSDAVIEIFGDSYEGI